MTRGGASEAGANRTPYIIYALSLAQAIAGGYLATRQDATQEMKNQIGENTRAINVNERNIAILTYRVQALEEPRGR